jgi:hypothetical protein
MESLHALRALKSSVGNQIGGDMANVRAPLLQATKPANSSAVAGAVTTVRKVDQKETRRTAGFSTDHLPAKRAITRDDDE